VEVLDEVRIGKGLKNQPVIRRISGRSKDFKMICCSV